MEHSRKSNSKLNLLSTKLKTVVWNIGFIEIERNKILDHISGSMIQWLEHPYHDRFFADPFILEIRDDYYIVLAEEYFLHEQKGRIVKLIVDIHTKKLINRSILIESDFHLSFPFIYKECIYPEQSRGNIWMSYALDGKEHKNVGKGLIDAVILDYNEKSWVFASRVKEKKVEACRKLYRYQLGTDGRIIEDSELEIKNTFTNSRMAGAFFWIGDKLYRPAQNSTKDIYGESVTINEVLKNDEDGYVEKEVVRIDSHSKKRYYEGLHTLNVYDDVCIIDGFEMQIHPILKTIAKVRRFLCCRGK